MTVQSNTGGGPEEFYGSQSGAGGQQGFYGVTPVARQAVAPTLTTTVTTTELAVDVAAIRTAMENLGLIS